MLLQDSLSLLSDHVICCYRISILIVISVIVLLKLSKDNSIFSIKINLNLSYPIYLFDKILEMTSCLTSCHLIVVLIINKLQNNSDISSIQYHIVKLLLSYKEKKKIVEYHVIFVVELNESEKRIGIDWSRLTIISDASIRIGRLGQERIEVC